MTKTCRTKTAKGGSQHPLNIVWTACPAG